jgi:hypothetical protein
MPTASSQETQETGAVAKRRFITGSYTKSSCSAIITGDHPLTHRLLNSPSRLNVSERLLSGNAGSTGAITFATVVRAAVRLLPRAAPTRTAPGRRWLSARCNSDALEQRGCCAVHRTIPFTLGKYLCNFMAEQV